MVGEILLLILMVVLVLGLTMLIFSLVFMLVDDRIFNGKLSDYTTKWIDKKLSNNDD